MSTAALNLPYAPGADKAGTLRSFVLAALVHGVLCGFLYFGVRWQSAPPEIYSAELWTPPQTVPAVATKTEVRTEVRTEAPRVEPLPEPKPAVKDDPKPLPKPDIAEKTEKKKPEVKPLPKPRLEDDPVKRALEQEKIDQDLRREAIAQAAARDTNLALDRSRRAWEAQIAASVRSRVRLPDNLAGNPEAVFEVTLLPGMEILGVKLLKSSGNPAYDGAAERAILAASPLPPPPPGITPERTMRFPFRPKN